MGSKRKSHMGVQIRLLSEHLFCTHLGPIAQTPRNTIAVRLEMSRVRMVPADGFGPRLEMSGVSVTVYMYTCTCIYRYIYIYIYEYRIYIYIYKERERERE